MFNEFTVNIGSNLHHQMLFVGFLVLSLSFRSDAIRESWASGWWICTRIQGKSAVSKLQHFQHFYFYFFIFFGIWVQTTIWCQKVFQNVFLTLMDWGDDITWWWCGGWVLQPSHMKSMMTVVIPRNNGIKFLLFKNVLGSLVFLCKISLIY